MIASVRRRTKKEAIAPPGDDVVPAPPPVKEEPPFDRFCDLVLTGGVASGVVYPWAIVEIARAYRFRNIGGTSVGAMAAALAAAAEYGRRTGFEAPFEVLRRAPAALARTLPDGRTRMLSLFQPNARGERLMRFWGRFWCGDAGRTPEQARCPRRGGLTRAVRTAVGVYAGPLAWGALVGLVVAAAGSLWLSGSQFTLSCPRIIAVTVLALLGALLGALVWGTVAVLSDIRHGLIDNFLGLCKGGTVERQGSGERLSGLSEWLHDGIQASAGLKDGDPPLTFQDLWTAPAYPGAERQPCGPDDMERRRSINLQMITTNVTHGRPYRLPLVDETSRLFFLREELKDYFPAAVLDALEDASIPYAPQRDGDPPVSADTQGMFELPRGKLPVVVAARLSLSFPLLFAAVPLWAIDHEAPRGERTLRRCLFTDGGASSNFPIHLFDSAVPRWPTFGLWLDRRPPYRYEEDPRQGTDQDVWLPKFNAQGWGDNWNRFDPKAMPPPAAKSPSSVGCPQPAAGSFRGDWQMLLGFLRGIASGATDWQDRTALRLPHTRNRVARLMLLPGEGGLNIGMPREQILQMAHRYGTKAGRLFVERFKDRDGEPSSAWSEQRWIRFNLLLNGLRERLDGLATSAVWSAHTTPLQQAIVRAQRPGGPVVDRAINHGVAAEQVAPLTDLLERIEALEVALQRVPTVYAGKPAPELRLRPPL